MMNKYARELVTGFLHTDGRVMKNGNNEEILLCGWGAGAWNNPEGFMCGDPPRPWTSDDPHATPGRFERARSIEDSIRLLCGSEYEKHFWPQWYENHLGEADIRKMAELGYNSIRLPLNARAFLAEEPGYQWKEENFKMLDRIVDWCEQYKLYAILDLHTVPGGQTGLKCDDGLDSVPRFYLEEESMERSICLWEKLAERYKDRWIVGGYDLLNEPLAKPETLEMIPLLIAYYERLIPRIRAIDKRHMLTIEGASASTNMEIFDRNYDPECNNWCIHIHYYGFSPEIRSFYPYLESSLRLNVPVWLGEGGGEQSEAGALLQVAAALDMGYNLWGWKIADNPAKGAIFRSPVKFDLPARWPEILNALNEGGARPGYMECQEIFNEFLENIKLEHCRLDVTQHACFLGKQGRIVPAAAYDPCLRPGVTFSGAWQYGNPFNFRTEDKMHLVLKEGSIPPRNGNAFASQKKGFQTDKPLQHLDLQLDPGDFACYTVNEVVEPCRVFVQVKAVSDGATLHAECAQGSRDFPVSSGSPSRLLLFSLESADQHTVRLSANKGSLLLSEMIFE